MKDGQPLPNHPRMVANRQTLQIFNLQREDYGMYQCFVARGSQEAQASSELRLGGKNNILVYLIKIKVSEIANTNSTFSHERVFCIGTSPNGYIIFLESNEDPSMRIL